MIGMAEAFLSQGYRVVLNYHSDEENAKQALEKLHSENAIIIKANVTLPKQREHLLAKTVDQFGGFDTPLIWPQMQ